MRSTSGSMSRSMSLSRTVSSDRSMSIEDEQNKRHQDSDKYSGPFKDEYKPSTRDKESRHRRSYSRSSSRRRSSSSDSYDKYKNYKNFRKSKYSRSLSSSRSYSRSSSRSRRSRSYSYSTSSRSSSRRSSLDSKSSVSRSRSRTLRRLRRRGDFHRSTERRSVRDRRSSRDRGRGRFSDRRNLGRRPLRDKPRLEDKFNFEDEPRLNGRNRLNERLNGFRKGSNRETKKEFKVDRKYNTPFLLKVFASGVGEDSEESTGPEELHVYVWLDSTLRDLVNLIKDISPPTRSRSNTWTFSTNKGEKSVELGNVHCFKPNAREDNRTLESLKFEIGSSLNLTFKD